MKTDGTSRRKITSERILDVNSVSPDGRWVVASTTSSDEDNPASIRAFAVDGSAVVPLCGRWCLFRWDTTGKSAYLFFPGLSKDSYSIPVIHDLGLPKIPPAGFAGIKDIPNEKTNSAIPWFVESAVSRSVYAYSRVNTRRNLYRIHLP